MKTIGFCVCILLCLPLLNNIESFPTLVFLWISFLVLLALMFFDSEN